MSHSIAHTTTSKSVSGLDTYIITPIVSGFHTAKIKVDTLSGSGVSVVIKKNASVLATSTALSPGQKYIVLTAPNISITLGDTISFVLTSSAGVDQTPNSIKAHINVYLGSN